MTIALEAKYAAKLAMNIPGQVHCAELEYLYRLARRKGDLVEIGCLHGRSTSILVQAAAIFKAQVTSIDPFVYTPNTQPPSKEFWELNLLRNGIPQPALLEMKSHEAREIYQDEISLLFIDGDHSLEGVRTDIDDWICKVKIDGMVVFHDAFHPNIPSVTHAISEWWLCDYKSWKLEGIVDYMIAFRRVL